MGRGGEEDHSCWKWFVVNCIMSAVSVEVGREVSSEVCNSGILVLLRCVQKHW